MDENYKSDGEAAVVTVPRTQGDNSSFKILYTLLTKTKYLLCRAFFFLMSHAPEK